ncbi:MAG: methyltransferase domain-containing protein [Chloroflexi bacterium]|nr:methyltransferase domain-containing protein [Chloroflexota bacterium]
MKPDVDLARERYRALAPTYDRQVQRGSRRVRRLAVERLALRPGDAVLDVGCGTGLSFPLLEERIGREGRVFGVEATPHMLALAGKRVETNGWTNVTLIEAPAEEAVLPQPADAMLFHFVHDVTRSPAAIANIFGQVKPGARVAAAGGKWAPWWAVPANAYMWYLARRYTTTLEGFDRPWGYIQEYVPDLKVESMLFGVVYVAWGTLGAVPAGKEAR